MPCRGIYTVITEDESAELKLASSAEEAEAFTSELEDKYFGSDRQREIDVSWDGMHRCFDPDATNLTMDTSNPFNLIVLGGENLIRDRGWRSYQLAVLKTPEQVRKAATACATVDRENLRVRYDSIDPRAYDGTKCDDDFAYVWSWFEHVVAFYDRASKLNEPVLFTANG